MKPTSDAAAIVLPLRSPLLRRAVDLPVLLSAWRKVRANRGCAGADRITLAIYGADLDDNLYRLRKELLNGCYRPRPMLEAFIPKRGGGERRLVIPAVRDRILQTAVQTQFVHSVEAELEDSCFAYRPGRGVHAAVDRIRQHYLAGFRWVVEADIRRYFDNIVHERMLALSAELIPDRDLVSLIDDWLRARIHGRSYDYRMTCGIPQGSPISPLLANLYLDEFDEAVARCGHRLVRYADDFILLCRTREEAECALEEVRSQLAMINLRLNGSKTGITCFDAGFSFLGHLFLRSMIVSDH